MTKFTLKTTPFPSGLIEQELTSDDSHERLWRFVADTREQHFRDALVKLGWTPPPETPTDKIKCKCGRTWKIQDNLSAYEGEIVLVCECGERFFNAQESFDADKFACLEHIFPRPTCPTCRNFTLLGELSPCNTCTGGNKWIKGEQLLIRHCGNCRNESKSIDKEPSNWKPKGEPKP